jgi:hypothetical protein
LVSHRPEELEAWGFKRDMLYREYLMLLEKADEETPRIGAKRTRCEVDEDSDDMFIDDFKRRA